MGLNKIKHFFLSKLTPKHGVSDRQRNNQLFSPGTFSSKVFRRCSISLLGCYPSEVRRRIFK